MQWAVHKLGLCGVAECFYCIPGAKTYGRVIIAHKAGFPSRKVMRGAYDATTKAHAAAKKKAFWREMNKRKSA